jgi:hypothetical protein
VLDLDATDDPRHDPREERFFRSYHNNYCHPPCVCSASSICERPSCGIRSSTQAPAPRMRLRASSDKSEPAGRGCAFCPAPTLASPAKR